MIDNFPLPADDTPEKGAKVWFTPSGPNLTADQSPICLGTFVSMEQLPGYTMEQVFTELEAAKAAGLVVVFACTNPHWWTGVDSDGLFWWEYQCCDWEECTGGEYAQYRTIAELRENAGSIDQPWIKLIKESP